jgi:DNA transformation protein
MATVRSTHKPARVTRAPRAASAVASPQGGAANEFVAHCEELLAPLGPVRVRRMFGGHGIYLDELFIAIVTRECLYLKADAETEGRFRDAGCTPFIYNAKDKLMTMGYWTVPDDAMEAPPAMAPWARLAMAAALRARAAKKPAATQRRGNSQSTE